MEDNSTDAPPAVERMEGDDAPAMEETAVAMDAEPTTTMATTEDNGETEEEEVVAEEEAERPPPRLMINKMVSRLFSFDP